jgi:hypothetical protein
MCITMIVSVRHSPGLPLLSGSRESLPSSRMFSAPSTTFAGRPPVIWANGSSRFSPASMLR